MTDKPDNNVQISKQKQDAAGLKAVINAYKHAATKVGPIDGSKLLIEVNQIEGFDCPGCAWPDPMGKKSTFSFCENGAKAIADEATTKKADEAFFANNSITFLKTKSDRWLNEQGRLVSPLYKAERADHYKVISWTDAIDLMAHKLSELDNADEAAFYTSGRTSNEAAYLYQLFIRTFGTNNMPDCSNMCHESSGIGLVETIGIGKGTVSLDDLESSECIFIFGQNPGSNHPRMLASLQAAKRRNCKIVSINPLDEAGLQKFNNPQEISGLAGQGTKLRDLHLPIKINGDAAFLTGLAKFLFEKHELTNDVLDVDFIQKYCEGFESFKEHINTFVWEDITEASGLTKKQIQEAGAYLLESKKTIFCWAMGMTQHKNAVANIQLMANVLMLQGNLGKAGSGVCPVRGHSNVQGDRTMGIWENAPLSFINKLNEYHKLSLKSDKGVNTIECIEQMHQEKIKVFIGLGGNFYRAAPDHDFTEKALANCDLTVQISTKLNMSHLYTGKEALILPTLGRTEIDHINQKLQFVTVENSMGVIQTSHGRKPPASTELKSEVAIVGELALKLSDTHTELAKVKWQNYLSDYAEIREAISNTIEGFDNFNERINSAGEFMLPNPVRDQLKFNTHNGKANFIQHSIESAKVKANEFILMTIRSHDQFNTTVYTNHDRYRGIKGTRRVIFINKSDAEKLGYSELQKVSVQALSNKQKVVHDFILVFYDIPKGCIAGYYPETNNLISIKDFAHKSFTPAYKSVPVRIVADEE
ncbi:FdhF/YdeP family oxidoreductase [Glaciecola sp. MF2-115]|uniref:FdhF/YdeP family oxidoreductase n=1 Tax=Glaciecola sp. MF2-115 TaxID=3384827 RepID=UPI0039A39B42